MTFWDYTDDSNKGLIYPYTFLYIIIILLIEKFIFIDTQLVKKIYYEKCNIFTCRMIFLVKSTYPPLKGNFAKISPYVENNV